jgi:hypothetical protein
MQPGSPIALITLAVVAIILFVANAQAAANRSSGNLADLRVNASEFDEMVAFAPVLASATDDAAPLWAQLEGDSGRAVDVYAFEKKSPVGAFFRSFLIPGWGQYYVRSSWWKPVLFLGAEAASWYGVTHNRSTGHDTEDEYKAFADEYWNSEKYLEGLYTVYYPNDVGAEKDDPYLDTRPYAIINEENQWDTLVWSHHAFYHLDGTPVEEDEYYENIGKYHQFNFGWDDYPGINDPNFPSNNRDDENLTWVSPRRNTYLHMRDDANKAFKRASTLIVVAIANHLISGLDAAYGARRHNRSLDEFGSIDAEVRMVLSPATGKPMPHVTLGYRF